MTKAPCAYLALPLVTIATAAILVACAGSSAPPPEPSPTPMGPRVDHCGVGLVEADRERGFSSAPIDPAPGGLIVDALLVENASGASIEGRPLAYAGRLQGELPKLHAATDRLMLEARHADAGSVASPAPSLGASCAGSIRLLLTNDLLTRPDQMGTAVVTATLDGADVRGGTADACFARRADSTIGVECSLASVRRGDTSTSGILRLRLAWSGTPVEVGALAGWAEDLLAAAWSPPAYATPAPMTWAVSADHPSLVDDQLHMAGNVTVRPEAGTIRYRLDLPVLHKSDAADSRERAGRLYVAISGYLGPGDYGQDLITGEVTLRGDGTWGEPGDRHYELSACRATLGADGADSRLECAIGAMQNGSGTGVIGHLSATWRVESVPSVVGRLVEVTWRLGGHYRSEGQATVSRYVSKEAGRYEIPQVRVGGTPANPEVLRIAIMPFTGDGSYTGDAVTVMLDNVTGDSPQVIVDGNRWSDAWTPVFGDCVVTVQDEGASGRIECPGRAAPGPLFRGGSTTLTASWRLLESAS